MHVAVAVMHERRCSSWRPVLAEGVVGCFEDDDLGAEQTRGGRGGFNRDLVGLLQALFEVMLGTLRTGNLQ